MSEVSPKVIIITQGEKAEFTIYVNKTVDGIKRPFDLTNFDEFKLCLPGSSATLEITQTANGNGSSITKVSPDTSGELKVVIGSGDTSNLRSGFGQDMTLELNNGTTPNPKRRNLHEGLNVEESLCS